MEVTNSTKRKKEDRKTSESEIQIKKRENTDIQNIGERTSFRKISISVLSERRMFKQD